MRAYLSNHAAELHRIICACLPVAVSRFSSDDVAIRYVLPIFVADIKFSHNWPYSAGDAIGRNLKVTRQVAARTGYRDVYANVLTREQYQTDGAESGIYEITNALLYLCMSACARLLWALSIVRPRLAHAVDESIRHCD